MLKKIIITGLVGAGGYTGYTFYKSSFNNPKKNALPLTKEKFIPLTVSKITPYNHNTSIFRLKFQKPLKESLPIASCVLVKDDSSQIMRPYTPISLVNEPNHIDLMIKRYDNGHMSKLIHSLKVGDQIDVKGPIVTLPYTANMKKHIGMVRK
jgi:cytochrome-b5 reductase